jgi:hypothetical protein
MLLHQLHAVDGHASVHRFAHVINGEQGHLHSGQVLSEINNLHPQAFSLFPIFCWIGGTKMGQKLSCYKFTLLRGLNEVAANVDTIDPAL